MIFLKINNIEDEIKGISDDINLKEDVFNYLKIGKPFLASKILLDHRYLIYYYRKFKSVDKSILHTKTNDLIISTDEDAIVWGEFDRYRDDLFRELNELKSKLEEKKNRLEQFNYLKEQSSFIKEQKEYVRLQKLELQSNDENRKEMSNFTFVIALGVLISLFVSFYGVMIDFSSAKTLHGFFISLIFVFVFLYLIYFVGYHLKVYEKIALYLTKTKLNMFVAILITIIVIAAIVILIVVPDMDLNKNKVDSNLETISKELSTTNGILNLTVQNNDLFMEKLLQMSSICIMSQNASLKTIGNSTINGS